MIRLAKKTVMFFLGLSTRMKNVFKLLQNKSLCSGESYFPEYADRRKGKFAIFKDLLSWILKYGDINEFYYLYGFDIKGFKNPNDFVDYRAVFRTTRDRLNKTANSPFIVLRDKFLFGIVAEGLGINTPHNLALIDDGKILVYSNQQVKRLGVVKISELRTLFPNLDAFAKIIDGECANGVFHIEANDGIVYVDGEKCGMDKLQQKFAGKRYILQQRINQHESLSAIFPKSINTIRLVTVYDEKSNEIEVLSAVLRVGRGNNHVDNWAAGGLSIGIDIENGSLRKYGFYKPGYGTKTTIHPDSNVTFEGYNVPYLSEAVEMAKRFHYYLKGVHSIGWDIAIAPTGPCFIEGNDNWEISLMQVCNGGLQSKFKELFI